ncbi:MAG: T9SS type A sorting domain-containing protein [Flavobacteriales bacterium]|nr:T9SS type A sorting domain-containing protein [Flavobacteriales bacterium]
MKHCVFIFLLLIAAQSRAQYLGGIGGGGDYTCGSGFQILPVELLYFKASVHDHAVQLEWATATEHNNAGFTVERSTDGLRFDAIAELPGAGNSVQVVVYDALDRAPLPGTSYYRLLQTDFDGTTSYSDVVSVTIAKSELLAYPNPADDRLWITGTSSGDDVVLMDAMGRTLRTVPANDALFSLDLSDLPAGRYVIRVAGAGGLRTVPVVKR